MNGQKVHVKSLSFEYLTSKYGFLLHEKEIQAVTAHSNVEQYSAVVNWDVYKVFHSLYLCEVFPLARFVGE